MLSIAAIAPCGVLACSALVDGSVRDVWITADADGGAIASVVHADQGTITCVASVTNGLGKNKTVEASMQKLAEPERAAGAGLDVDAGPAGPRSIRVGDVVVARREPAPVGTNVPFLLTYGALDDHGKPDPNAPLAPGSYRCTFRLSNDDEGAVDFSVLCPAGRITAGAACTSDRVQCPRSGAGSTSAACTCEGDAWVCP